MKRSYVVILFLYALLSNSSSLCLSDKELEEAPSQEIYKRQKDIKVLVLIIASDQLPVYTELYKIWHSYMHYDPRHVEAYFIRGDPELPTWYEIKGDVIWSKTTEGWVPQSAGILNKTILSLEAMMPRMHEFDYILRTNLSSFYIFPRLLDFLKKLPKKRCYCGSDATGGGTIASGCGFIITPDVAELIVKNKRKLLNLATAEDDLILGGFIRGQRISLIQHPRMSFYTLADWHATKDKIPATMFHFRIKHADALRLENEIYIQSELVKMFYNGL